MPSVTGNSSLEPARRRLECRTLLVELVLVPHARLHALLLVPPACLVRLMLGHRQRAPRRLVARRCVRLGALQRLAQPAYLLHRQIALGARRLRLLRRAIAMSAGAARSLTTSRVTGLTPGPYAVGVRTIQLTDESRQEDGAPRQLQTEVWYPAGTVTKPRSCTTNVSSKAPSRQLR